MIQALIVVTCSEANLPTLLETKALDGYRPARKKSSGQELSAHLVVHRVPREVWSDPRYKDLIRTFGNSTQVG